MSRRAYLISWDKKEAKQATTFIESAGWHVAGLETRDGGKALKAIAADVPDAVVIYLTRNPSHGYETAVALRENSKTADLPIVFVGGPGQLTAQMKLEMPDATFSFIESLTPKLRKMAAE